MSERPTVGERARGILLGLGVGNALGIELEGRPSEEIRRSFPGGVAGRGIDERGNPWDDDVAQAIVLAEAMPDAGTLDLDDLGARMVRWHAENGRGIGVLTSRVIARLERGVPAERAAREVWEASDRRAAGNGAVMRCAPVAIRWRDDPERLVHETRISALVTHHDPRCTGSATAFTLALAAALRGEEVDPAAAADRAGAAGAPREVVEAARAAAVPAVADLGLDGPDMGYTLKAMQVGLWALARGVADPEGVAATLGDVVEAGGDTDTNGAVAGAALGAAAGEAAIPERWVRGLPDPAELASLADRLLEPPAGR